MTYRKTFVKEYLTVLQSEGRNPLGVWMRHGKDGFVRRVWDTELKSLVVDIQAPNVSTCSIKTRNDLGVALPCLTLLVKNMNKYFNFEIKICDNFQIHRRLRFSNFQSRVVVSTFDLAMPLCLNTKDPWNMIRFDLSRLVSQAFGTVYRETTAITINANCRLRRVYFSKTLIPDQLLPDEFTVKPKYRTKTQKLQKDEQEVPSPHPLPPSIVPSQPIFLPDDTEFQDYEFGAESLTGSYPGFQLMVPQSFSSHEGELDAEDETATFIVCPKSPLTKNISTQTMIDEFLPTPPKAPSSEELSEVFAEEPPLHYEFSNPSFGEEESCDEILLSISQ